MNEDPEDRIEYISVDEMIRIHERMIYEIGGEPGILYRGNLDFLIAIMNEDYFLKFDILSMASRIMNGIIRGHPFVDGNKRTGFEVADTFLRMNGLRIDCTPEEGIELTLTIARCEMTDEDIKRWLEDHTKIYIQKRII